MLLPLSFTSLRYLPSILSFALWAIASTAGDTEPSRIPFTVFFRFCMPQQPSISALRKNELPSLVIPPCATFSPLDEFLGIVPIQQGTRIPEGNRSNDPNSAAARNAVLTSMPDNRH